MWTNCACIKEYSLRLKTKRYNIAEWIPEYEENKDIIDNLTGPVSEGFTRPCPQNDTCKRNERLYYFGSILLLFLVVTGVMSNTKLLFLLASVDKR